MVNDIFLSPSLSLNFVNTAGLGFRILLVEVHFIYFTKLLAFFFFSKQHTQTKSKHEKDIMSTKNFK